MIAKIARQPGSDINGLIEYLFGPGRRNEHSNPHLIAGHTAQHLPGAPDFTSIGGLAALAAELDGDRRLLPVPDERPSVWHCALSIPADDRTLSDAEWAEAARMLVEALRFTERDGRGSCQWAAIRHGLSANGNDHIHITASLIREDGSRANDYRLWPIASRVCAELEHRFGLTVIDGRAGAGRPSLSRAELARAARSGQEPERIQLGRIVRAAATIAVDEAEFARRLHATVRVRPRVTDDGRITGYAVALDSADSEPTIWFGGGRLASDLTIPRLRENWPDVQSADNGLAYVAWHGNDLDVGREDARLSGDNWQEAADRVERTCRQLEAAGGRDQGALMDAAGQTAGVFAALFLRFERSRPGAFASISDALAKVSLARAGRGESRRHGVTVFADLRTVAYVGAQAITNTNTASGQNALLKQLMQLVEAIIRLRAAQVSLAQSWQGLEDAVAMLPTAQRRPTTTSAGSASSPGVPQRPRPPSASRRASGR